MSTPAILRASSFLLLLLRSASASKLKLGSQAAVAAAEPVITPDDQTYTGCATCLADPGKKYCVTEPAGANAQKTLACCNISDYSNELCNSRLQGVSCSDTFGIDGSDSASFEKYLVCPISEEVCGAQREFQLNEPDILGSLTSESVDI